VHWTLLVAGRDA